MEDVAFHEHLPKTHREQYTSLIFQMRVFEAYKSRIRKFFNAGARLDNVEPKDTIVA